MGVMSDTGCVSILKQMMGGQCTLVSTLQGIHLSNSNHGKPSLWSCAEELLNLHIQSIQPVVCPEELLVYILASLLPDCPAQ